MIRPHPPRWLKIIVAIYLAYLALVLLVATPLLNIFAPKIYREQTGRELQLGKTIWLNPFTLELSAREASTSEVPDIQSNEGDQHRLWSFDALKLNISLASIWRGHVVLDALELHGLSLQIDQTAPERFNFSDILDYRAKHFPAAPAAAPATTGAAASKPFAIEIDQLVFSAAHLGYRTPYASEPLATTISDLSFALTNFSTLPEPDGTAPQATMPALHGAHIALALKSIELDFLRAQQPFKTNLRDVKITVPALSTTANSDYEISLLDSRGGSAHIKGSAALAQHRATGSLQLRALNLVPAWQYLADKLAFEAQHALLDGDIDFNVSWGEKLSYQIKDSQLALRDVQLQSRADADTGAAFNALRVDGIAVDSAQPQVHIARIALEQPVLRGWNRDTKVSLLDMIYFPSSEEQDDASPWQVRVDNIDVDNGSVHWRASQLDNRQLTIAPLAIHASNLYWPEPAPLQFNATATINSATAASKGDSGANTATARTNDNIKVAFNGELVPGDVTGNINGTIANLPLAWGNTLVQQQLRASIASGTLSSKFAVKLDKAQPTLVQSEGSIDSFELQTKTSAQLGVTDRRKLAAWKKLEWRQLTLKPSQQRIDIKQVVLTQPWTQFRINADGTNNFQQLAAKTEAASADNSAKLRDAAEKKSTSATEKPWRFAIANIAIDRATIDFRDASLSSAFRTNITDLSGNIADLDTSDSMAKVALKGTVDGYAPVAIIGGVNPFAAKPTLDITLDMTNLDLATLTPYAGTYAGYHIDSGRLTVQLAYTMQDGRIKGTNHIIVNQMQLGKQVSGPKVMDLPLRFAIYLLTDADGVMDLGVDVTGNVDDPDFSVGSIIWKAFRNLIVKTVTSPFRALGNLVGSDRDDLDRVAFAAGGTQVLADENEKLATVNKALQQKPKLKLAVTGHVSPSQDLEALRDNSLSAQLIAQGGITPQDIQQQTKNWQREVVKLFKQRFPDEKTDQWQVMQMNDAMRDNEELASQALQELAAERALAVKEMLVTQHGLAPDRAFVKPTDLGADKTPGLQATLEVE